MRFTLQSSEMLLEPGGEIEHADKLLLEGGQ
ncbi:hypothetical protein PsgB076_02061 [Pseudomonas savastanoi pv. glycinea str. B076]|nr:hypothetical protein PsgB076_02061 [Pseudomonas savastanoi pv. glycinea str. B076]